METGTIPHDLKIAKVIPLFKTGDPGSFTNSTNFYIAMFFKEFRKTSVQKNPGTLEYTQYSYCHQYGFHKNHSFYMALLELTDRIHTHQMITYLQ